MTATVHVKSTQRSSRELGPCEVCAEHAPEMFLRSHGDQSVFGHRACLLGRWWEILAAAERFQTEHHGVAP